MLKSSIKILKKHIKSDEKIAVAVSGGIDSMCLLHLTASILPKSQIIALNVEHGIRGDDSKNDSEFVKEQCEKLGVELIMHHVDIPALSILSGRSIETEAREARKSFFANIIAQNAAKYVLLAHHSDDQVESVLMHIFRGCGIQGLIGMQILTGNILRPLLETTRAEIYDYVKHYNIPYVEDSSNKNNEYNRNFLRNNLLPLIRKRWNGVDNAVLNLAKAANENQSILLSLIDENKIYTDELAKGIIKLDIDCFNESQPTASYIFSAISRLGINKDVENKHISLIRSLLTAKNGSKLNLTNDIIVIKEYDRITLYLNENDNITTAKDDIIPFSCGKISFKETTCEILSFDDYQTQHHSLEASIPKSFKALSQKDLIHLSNTGIMVFDGEKVPKNAVIRSRKDGDIFKAVGRGTKKLKDFLIDKKLPQRLRDSLPCLCSNNEVLLIFGMEISEKIKIDEATTLALVATTEKDRY